MPECDKIKEDGLDQYSAERFGRLVFATVRNNVGLKGLIQVSLFVVRDECDIACDKANQLMIAQHRLRC